MHRHRRIAQQRFGAGGGDDQEAAGLALHRVAQVPEVALHLAALDLQVGNRGQQLRVPVHQPAVAIDQLLRMQGAEHLHHRLRQAGIHGEALSRPIQAGTQPAQLAGDGAAAFRLPLPDAIEEGVAAHGAAVRLAFGGQQAFHHHLGGDAGMVGARLPQRIAPLHPPPAGQRILQGEGQGMAHMQAAGDVRRRDHDGEGRRRTGRVAGEGAALLPALIQAGFESGGGQRFVQHGG